ncbi:MAG TPA: Hsp20/alpha crystallin family protein [Nitrospiraceae bacterium]|nr:Hsp20/alpha crystallin family protein [Nitrospiraceae bacterium]
MAKEKSKELVKVEPAKPVSPFEEMERRFEEFFRRPLSLLGPSWFPRLRIPEMEEFTPTIDIFEEGSDVVVKAELPGMKKEDLDVKLTDNTITISGEKKKEEKVEKKDFYRMERSYGSFTRAFSLPSEVQTDKVKAQFKEGILEIRVPKTEEAKQKEKKVLIE